MLSIVCMISGVIVRWEMDWYRMVSLSFREVGTLQAWGMWGVTGMARMGS